MKTTRDSHRMVLLLLGLNIVMPAQESTAKKDDVEILGLESWTRERFTAAVKEQCKGRW